MAALDKLAELLLPDGVLVGPFGEGLTPSMARCCCLVLHSSVLLGVARPPTRAEDVFWCIESNRTVRPRERDRETPRARQSERDRANEGIHQTPRPPHTRPPRRGGSWAIATRTHAPAPTTSDRTGSWHPGVVAERNAAARAMRVCDDVRAIHGGGRGGGHARVARVARRGGGGVGACGRVCVWACVCARATDGQMLRHSRTARAGPKGEAQFETRVLSQVAFAPLVRSPSPSAQAAARARVEVRRRSTLAIDDSVARVRTCRLKTATVYHWHGPASSAARSAAAAAGSAAAMIGPLAVGAAAAAAGRRACRFTRSSSWAARGRTS